MGVLFLANAAAGVAAGAALVLTRDRVLVPLGAAAYAAGTLAAFVASTRWGLFGYRERFWGSWQEAAGGIELAALALAAPLAAGSPSRGARRRPCLDRHETEDEATGNP